MIQTVHNNDIKGNLSRLNLFKNLEKKNPFFLLSNFFQNKKL